VSASWGANCARLLGVFRFVIFRRKTPTKSRGKLDIQNSYRTYKSTVFFYRAICHVILTISTNAWKGIWGSLGNREISVVRKGWGEAPALPPSSLASSLSERGGGAGRACAERRAEVARR